MAGFIRARIALMTLLFAASCLFGCGMGAFSDPVAAKSPTYVTRVWFAPEVAPWQNEIMAGCELWAHKGVACRKEQVKEFASIRVYADAEQCLRKEDDTRTLAWMAITVGDMTFRKKCFVAEDGKLFADKLVSVAGHEFGHGFGIKWHVPGFGLPIVGGERRTALLPFCAHTTNGATEGVEQIRNHPDGEKICGDAIMNRYYHGVMRITEVDSRAFDVRDVEQSPGLQRLRPLQRLLPSLPLGATAGHAHGSDGDLCTVVERVGPARPAK